MGQRELCWDILSGLCKVCYFAIQSVAQIKYGGSHALTFMLDLLEQVSLLVWICGTLLVVI